MYSLCARACLWLCVRARACVCVFALANVSPVRYLYSYRAFLMLQLCRSQQSDSVLYRQCTVPTVYCTDSVLYRQCTVPTVFCTDSVLYRQCTVPTVYCTDIVLYRQCSVPTVYCTDSVLYRHCTVPTVYCTDSVTAVRFKPLVPTWCGEGKQEDRNKLSDMKCCLFRMGGKPGLSH
jgi:hypothetical protein